MTTPKLPPPELKNMGWISITLTTIVAAIAGVVSVSQGIMSDQLNRAPPGASSFEQGQVVGQFMGRGMGAAIVLWFLLWVVGRITRRRVGWRAFLIIAAAAVATTLTLYVVLDTARPAVA